MPHRLVDQGLRIDSGRHERCSLPTTRLFPETGGNALCTQRLCMARVMSASRPSPTPASSSRPTPSSASLAPRSAAAETHGWTRFVSMQNHLNLIYREEEREMLPLCREEGIGVTPYSPCASGRLTREWSSESTLRSETDQIAKSKYDVTEDADRQVVERVTKVAENHGVPRVHIALACLLQKEPVSAPIVGATKITHLESAAGALAVAVTQDEVACLEEPYMPHPVVGPV
ncbi:MAG TPA: aldo/keto reductase [Thermomicrobiales bacterium]|nr:aldo/keto reductase [Thermomicrobiales bacterium]